MLVRILSAAFVLLLISLCAIVLLAGIIIYDPLSLSKDVTKINWTLTTLSMCLAFIIIGLSWLLSADSCIDNKKIPIKHVSRCIMQNKVILVVDGKVFNKDTIDWTHIDLQFVEKIGCRNFWGKILTEDIFISQTGDFLIQTDSRPPHAEEYTTEDVDFKIGEDNEQGDHKV